MAAVVDAILTPIEKGFSALGLNHPLARGAVGFVAAAGAQIALQPEYAFDRGVPREWNVVASDQDSMVATTATPWWLTSGLAGVAVGMFI